MRALYEDSRCRSRSAFRTLGRREAGVRHTYVFKSSGVVPQSFVSRFKKNLRMRIKIVRRCFLSLQIERRQKARRRTCFDRLLESDAILMSVGSLQARPKNEIPTGSPKSIPAGTLIFG